MIMNHHHFLGTDRQTSSKLFCRLLLSSHEKYESFWNVIKLDTYSNKFDNRFVYLFESNTRKKNGNIYEAFK